MGEANKLYRSESFTCKVSPQTRAAGACLLGAPVGRRPLGLCLEPLLDFVGNTRATFLSSLLPRILNRPWDNITCEYLSHRLGHSQH